MIWAVTNQIFTSHGNQAFTDNWPTCWVVVTQQRLMQAALAALLRHWHHLTGVLDVFQRVQLSVINGRRIRHWRWIEVLHLVELKLTLLQPEREVEHILIGRAGMRRNKIRDQELLFTRFLRKLIEQLFKLIVGAHAGFHHLAERPFFGMLRGDF